jgi:hypothetical protein
VRESFVAAIKISSKVEKSVWDELKALAAESRQNVSGLLTDAIREYVRRRRVRPDVLRHLDDSLAKNEKLGRLLAE